MEGQVEATPIKPMADWISPWFTICFSPRATMRKIVDNDPAHFVIGIAWVAGALAALDLEIQFNDGGPLPGIPQFLINLFSSMGPFALAGLAFSLGVLGVAMLFLFGFLYWWAGGVLGGTATAAEVRSALAWTQAPAIYVTILGVIVAVMSQPALNAQPGAVTSIGWWSIARPLLGLWVFVIGLKTLGEVHRFSAWRAGAALMIGNLVMGIAFVLVILAVMVGRGLA